jgi:hypothetical protein
MPPEIIHLRAVLAMLRDHLAALRRQGSEAGSFSVETAIIAGLLALAAAGLAVVIYNKVQQKQAQISGT